MSHINSDIFINAILSSLVCKNRKAIPINDYSIDFALEEIFSSLEERVKDKLADPNFTAQIEGIIIDIGPDPQNGSYDRMKTAFRRRQPTSASVGNPYLDTMAIGISHGEAKSTLENLPPAWRSVIDDAARILSAVI